MNAEFVYQKARREAARARAAHLSKLPEWMHEYTDVIHGRYLAYIAIDLPGHAPIYVLSDASHHGYDAIQVNEPMEILYDPINEEMRVSTVGRYFETLEEAVAFAAECGESYWAMRREAEQRNMAGITPHKDAPAMPAPAPAVDAQPDPLERIADALERIAGRLENEVIYIARADVE